MYGKPNQLRALLEAGISPDSDSETDWQHPLLLTANYARFEKFKLIFDKTKNKRIMSHDGKDALIYAAQNTDCRVLDTLLKSRLYDLGHKDSEGKTALHYAYMGFRGACKRKQMLLEAGADITIEAHFSRERPRLCSGCTCTDQNCRVTRHFDKLSLIQQEVPYEIKKKFKQWTLDPNFTAELEAMKGVIIRRNPRTTTLLDLMKAKRQNFEKIASTPLFRELSTKYNHDFSVAYHTLVLFSTKESHQSSNAST